MPANINDNSEINKPKVQEQSQIYFNVPADKQTALERQINAEFNQYYLNVPANNNENEDLVAKVEKKEAAQVFYNAPQ